MKVYPNPTRSTAYVSIPSEIQGIGHLTIKNQAGETIEETCFCGKSAQLIPLNLQGQPNGFYKVTLNDGTREMSYELLNLGDMSCCLMD